MAEAQRREEYDVVEFSPKVEELPKVPVSQEQPEVKKKIKKISNLEKLVVVLLGILFIGLVFCSLTVRSTILKTTENISEIEQKIQKKEKQKEILAQEKSELSRTDRIKKIAEEKGLELKEENIRKVNP